MTCSLVISPYPLKTEIAAQSATRNGSPSCGQMAVIPLRITGPPPCPPPEGEGNSGPPEGEEDCGGSPFQTVWWPTRTPATSVMALWVPVGRNPTGIPESRARPLDFGGVDTSLVWSLLRQLPQFDVWVDLDVPVAVASRLDKEVVVDQTSDKDRGHREQVASLLLGERDD